MHQALATFLFNEDHLLTEFVNRILGIENSSVPVPYNGERVCSEDYLYIPRGLNPADLTGRYGQERYCGQIFGNLLAGPVLSYSKPFTIRQ
jgi:hypothetical protein